MTAYLSQMNVGLNDLTQTSSSLTCELSASFKRMFVQHTNTHILSMKLTNSSTLTRITARSSNWSKHDVRSRKAETSFCQSYVRIEYMPSTLEGVGKAYLHQKVNVNETSKWTVNKNLLILFWISRSHRALILKHIHVTMYFLSFKKICLSCTWFAFLLSKQKLPKYHRMTRTY